MTAFIKAIVKQDLTGLIKYGNPSIADLTAALDIVFNEYLTISGDTHISQLLALLKDVAILTNKIALIEFIVQRMAEKHYQGFADLLKSMGFRFEYQDGPQLKRELEVTIIQSKSLLLELEQNKAELEELRKTDGKAASEMDYFIQLSELGKFQGYAIDPDKLTVTSYCAILNRFKIYNSPKVA